MTSISDQISALTDSINNSSLWGFLGQPIGPISPIVTEDLGANPSYAKVTVTPPTWTTTNSIKLVVTYDSSEISFKKIELNGSGTSSISSSISEVGNFGQASIQMTSTGGKGFIIHFKPLDNSTSAEVSVNNFTINGISSSLSIPKIVGDFFPPTITTFTPADEAVAVAVGSNIVVTFSETITRGTGNIVLKSSTGAIVATYDAATSSNIAISGNTLTINPTSDLAYSTSYKVDFAAGTVKDLAGNAYAGTTSYNFTTKSSPTIFGGPGNDILTGGSGSLIDGFAGVDTVTYTGNRGSLIHNPNGTWTVGSDTLTNIERLQFADKKVALDVTDNALETLQFLGVIAPSLQGNLNVRGTILSLFDQGKSMVEMSQLALDLGLITSDNTALAKTVFKNVFNTTADPDQNLTDTLVNFIEQNGDATFLATVAGLNINVDLVGLQQYGMEFI